MQLLDLTCFNCLTLKSLSLTSFRQDMSFLFAVAVVDLEPNCQFSWLSFGILFLKKVFSILFWFLLIYRFFELLLDSIWDLRVVVWEHHRSSKDFSLLSVRKLKKKKKKKTWPMETLLLKEVYRVKSSWEQVIRTCLKVLIMAYCGCYSTVQHSVRALEFKCRDLLVSASVSGEPSKSTVCFLSKAGQKIAKRSPSCSFISWVR